MLRIFSVAEDFKDNIRKVIQHVSNTPNHSYEILISGEIQESLAA